MTLSGLVYCAYIGPRGLQKLLETNKSNSMCTFISVPVYLCISLFTNFLTASTYSLESALLHVYPSIYTGTHPSIHPSVSHCCIHLFIHLPMQWIYLSIYLSVHLPAYAYYAIQYSTGRCNEMSYIHTYLCSGFYVVNFGEL